jgi:hypothetical protein
VLLNIHLVVDFIIIELSEVYLVLEVSLDICLVEYIYYLNNPLNVLIIKINSLHCLSFCFWLGIWVKSGRDCVLELSQYGDEALLTELD